MATKMKTAETEIQILQMQEGSITCRVVGVTPLIMNRMSEKAKHELLLPKGKKTAADKAANLKHDIYAEFRASAYLDPDPKAPTRLRVMSTAFKKDPSVCASRSAMRSGRHSRVQRMRLPSPSLPSRRIS
jgi:hypothetical protein